MIYSNMEIEQALIGRMLHSDPKALASLDLTEDDFSEALHWQFFCEIRAGKTLFSFAKSQHWDYLRTLSDLWPMPLIGDDYSEILKELGRKRRIYSACKDVLDSLESRESSEILSFLNGTINKTAEVQTVKSRAEVRKQIIEGLEMPKKCYPTGLKNLDLAMGGGLYEGFTYGFCGREKAGKTTLAHSISHRLPCKHLYIAMEMGSHQIEQRNLARDLNINSLKFLEPPDGLKNKVETARVDENLFYHDAPGETVEQILHTVGMAILKHDIKGFVVDYWQLVTGQQKGESEEKHLRHVAQSIANFARKKKVWCILLAQMNKDGQLFGGNGLRKACDQLYMLEECGEHIQYGRWLRMDASRYTPKADIGNENQPGITLNIKSGPCFEQL